MRVTTSAICNCIAPLKWHRNWQPRLGPQACRGTSLSAWQLTSLAYVSAVTSRRAQINMPKLWTLIILLCTFFHSTTYLSSSSWPKEKEAKPATSATSCLKTSTSCFKTQSFWFSGVNCEHQYATFDGQQKLLGARSENCISHASTSHPERVKVPLHVVRVQNVYHPSAQGPAIIALSLTGLQLPGSSSLFLSVILPLSALLNLPWKPFSS